MVLDGAYARVSEVTHGGISELTIRGLLKQSKVELLDPFEQFRNEPLEHFFFFWGILGESTKWSLEGLPKEISGGILK